MSSDENSSSKRTRASGEVLDFLLQEFDRNHNPSPEQRKEISDKTSMSEKAVRIWFQNRRAKLRKFERMSKLGNGKVRKSYGGSGLTTTNGVANGSTAFPATDSIHSSRSNSLSLHDYISPNHTGNLPIELNDNYCFIDCSSLSVGSWQRIKSGYHDETALRSNLVNLSPFTLNSTLVTVDLLVILSKKNSEINYFFLAISNNSKILFRIFYPISSILTCSLLDNNINKENNELRLSLSHQPKFSVYFFNGINSNSNQWSICEDFSEGQQVSQAFFSEGGTSIPHVLVGVKNSLQYLNSFILENNLSHLNQQQFVNQSNQNLTSSTSGPPITDYHHQPQIHLEDDNYNPQGNFQFTTDDLNNIWDDASSMTPSRSNNQTPLNNLLPPSSANSITANPPANNQNHHARNLGAPGLTGFSPLTNFDSAKSPSSITSTTSFQKPNNYDSSTKNYTQSNSAIQSKYHSHSNSLVNIPQSASELHTNQDSNEPYSEMFNANTPDFFSTFEGNTSPRHDVGGSHLANQYEEDDAYSTNSNNNSPSHFINQQNNTINNPLDHEIHAYTHQNNNNHSLSNPKNNPMIASQDVLSDSLNSHRRNNSDFDFNLGQSGINFNNNDSTSDTPLSSIDISSGLENHNADSNSGNPGNHSPTNNRNSKNIGVNNQDSGSAGNVSNANIDGFIDYASNP